MKVKHRFLFGVAAVFFAAAFLFTACSGSGDSDADSRAEDTTPIPVDMERISAGVFDMGGQGGASPAHTVGVEDFFIGKYEVTQEQYQAVMGTNPSYFSGEPAADETPEKRPVENVTWYDAAEFCNALSLRNGLTPAYTISGRTVTWDRGADGYRLPTEAEWEYACRAGTADAVTSGSSWYYRNSGNKTHTVGRKTPNEWDLYDMYGNVAEWCWDWYAQYERRVQINPAGPESGVNRVARGGSWYSVGEDIGPFYRDYEFPSFRDSDLGFRLARTAPR
ncbi:MAG: formylglycine-generating enzyme family protein [Spirochaetaceae bacterium]|jgi:formylglycine-generating enzyme required for sulfatase activity|nr:formylglycine-generating enzyme family protein [Spirochaetaceae bacterium]